MRKIKPKLLLVEDDQPYRYSLIQALRLEFHVIEADNMEAAFANIVENIDIVVLDLRIPRSNSPNAIPIQDAGIAVLKHFHTEEPDIPVIVLTGFGTDAETAVLAMKDGAYDYIIKGGATSDIERLIWTCRQALQKSELMRENKRVQRQLSRTMEPRRAQFNILPGPPPQCRAIVAVSHEMTRILNLIKSVAENTYDDTVLITGETGTGKDLVAQAIHYNSKRAHNHMVLVNIASYPKDLLMSELFGQVKGAFTDAQERAGLFEIADKSTLFLDEVGDLPTESQVSLLRVLDDKLVRPLGASTVPRFVDVRVVAATNQDLASLVAAGSFRRDLFQRLSRVVINLPPLRDRKADINSLVSHCLTKASQATGAPVAEIESRALKLLEAYDWSIGNVRELQNVIEPLAKLSQGAPITASEVARELERIRGNADVILHRPAIPLLSVIRSNLAPLPHLPNSDESIRRLPSFRPVIGVPPDALALVRAFIESQGNVSNMSVLLQGMSRQRLQGMVDAWIIEVIARALVQVRGSITQLAEGWAVDSEDLARAIAWNSRVRNWLRNRMSYSTAEALAQDLQVSYEDLLGTIGALGLM